MANVNRVGSLLQDMRRLRCRWNKSKLYAATTRQRPWKPMSGAVGWADRKWNNRTISWPGQRQKTV